MANNFIHRWSKRKLETEADSAVESPFVEENKQTPKTVPTVKVDSVPSSESDESELASAAITETDSEILLENEQESEELSVAQLLVSEADKSVKKAALRKLFMSPEFNVVDGLNDYDHDYASVKSLSSEVAATLRDWVKDVTEPEPNEELTVAKENKIESPSLESLNEPTELANEKGNELEDKKEALPPEDESENSDRLA